LPAVLARVDGGYEVVLGPDELEPLGGQVDAFRAALQHQLTARGLVLVAG
jgi:hypothetical protein